MADAVLLGETLVLLFNYSMLLSLQLLLLLLLLDHSLRNDLSFARTY